MASYGSSETIYYDPDPENSSTFENIVRKLEQVIERKKGKTFGCRSLIIPTDVTPKIALKVMELSNTEPGGLGACTVRVKYSTGSNTYTVANIKFDRNIRTTYLIIIKLKKSSSTPACSFLPHFFNTVFHIGTVDISDDFSVYKTRKYS